MAGRNLCICMIDTGKFRPKVENTIVENPRVENPRFEQSGILRSGKKQEWKKPPLFFSDQTLSTKEY